MIAESHVHISARTYLNCKKRRFFFNLRSVFRLNVSCDYSLDRWKSSSPHTKSWRGRCSDKRVSVHSDQTGKFVFFSKNPPWFVKQKVVLWGRAMFNIWKQTNAGLCKFVGCGYIILRGFVACVLFRKHSWSWNRISIYRMPCLVLKRERECPFLLPQTKNKVENPLGS